MILIVRRLFDKYKKHSSDKTICGLFNESITWFYYSIQVNESGNLHYYDLVCYTS